MPTTAILEDLIDALEEQSESLLAYLDRDTGEVILISDESLSLGEAEPEEIASLPDWQKAEAELAVQIQTTDRFLALPDQFEVNEWEIMNEFCQQVKTRQPSDHAPGSNPRRSCVSPLQRPDSKPQYVGPME